MAQNELVKQYAAPPPAPGNPRATEAWALTQAAVRMRDAQRQNDPRQIVFTVHLNWRLWTILQADLLDPQCTVPDEIRRNMLSLAHFIDRHTIGLLAEPKPEMLDVLININREIAGGLNTNPAQAAEPAAEAPAARSSGISV